MQLGDNKNNDYQTLFTINAALRDEHKQLEVDYRSLKSSMEECSQPLDRLSKKLVPIRSEVQLLGKSIGGFSKMIYELSKNLTQGFTGSIEPHSSISLNTPSNLKNSFASLLGSFITGQRAMGGNVASGGTYLVGEKGPELFRPTASGRIESSNSRLSNPINIVMNINTKDANSFQRSQNQILAEAALLLKRATKNL
jgi:hypothetical protein